jgi:hypothetical protein
MDGSRRHGSHSKHRAFVLRGALVRALLAGAAALPGLPSPAFADAGDESGDTAAARNLAVDGMKLAQTGKCGEAIDKLERAEKLHHSAIVLGKLGECYVQEGRVVDGTEALRKMLREPLPPQPTPALEKAYERAQSVLDTALPKVAGVTVTVKVPPGADVTTKLDGRIVPPALLGVERPVDPGDHVVEATAPGYLRSENKFSAGPGDKLTMSLDLEKDPSWKPPEVPLEAAAPAAPSGAFTTEPSREPPAEPPPERHAPNRTAAYVAWGVGAAGLAVGAGFGIVAWTGKKKLDDSCNGNVCAPDQSDRLDSSKLAGNVATIGLGVGAAGAILGTVFFFTAGSGSSEQPRPVAAHRKSRALSDFRARPFIGIGSAGFSGEF